MSDIISITLFCICACVLVKISGVSGEIKTLCSITAACLVTMKFLDGYYSVSASFSEIFSETGLDGEYLKIIFKSLGICYVTQLGCDCCKDCGENAIASQLELVGKAMLLATAMPLFRAAVELVKSLLLV
jgi:stage III sporulation protein AD